MRASRGQEETGREVGIGCVPPVSVRENLGTLYSSQCTCCLDRGAARRASGAHNGGV